MSVVNGEGQVVACAQPLFNTFTCFDSKNIAELRTAIGEVTNDSQRKKLEKVVKVIDTSVYYAKEAKAKSHDLGLSSDND